MLLRCHFWVVSLSLLTPNQSAVPLRIVCVMDIWRCSAGRRGSWWGEGTRAGSAGMLTLRRNAWRLKGCRKLGSSAAGGTTAGMSSFSHGGFLCCRLLLLSLRASPMVQAD